MLRPISQHVLVSIAVLLLMSVASADEPRKIFVTSSSGSAILGTWPDAGGATGLAAGDAICQARAADAGLANPGNFVAWLSSENDDAYCRIHGLGGKKTANCGQASLPALAGPWMRTDGSPFGEAINRLLAPHFEVYTPARFDEFGDAVNDALILATGTSNTGELQQGSCESWTSDSSSNFVLGGVSDGTIDGWTSSVGTTCSVSSVRLLCFERLPGSALNRTPATGRLGFVTSATGPGDLSAWPEATVGTSGIAAGDSICRNLAAAAGLSQPDRFKAWLSDQTANAAARFGNDGAWVRQDGVLLAASIAELTSGRLFTGLAFDEGGNVITSAESAWTGSFANGTASTLNCQNWSSAVASASGTDGLVGRAGSNWSFFAGRACNTERRLYCLSDAPPPVEEIFLDRFETR